MIEYRKIDINDYPRRKYMEYFLSMNNPHVGVTAEVDVTDLKAFCKREGCSFFLALIHVIALSMDEIPELRHRIHLLPEGGFEIREYKECPTSHTETLNNGLYCYCEIHHHMPWKQYISQATELQAKARIDGTIDKDPEELEAFSFPTCLPWFHFSQLVHPVVDKYDSNPRIACGKFEENFRGRLMLPMTIQVNHGLVDGIHLGKFYKLVEENIIALIEGRL